MTKRGPDVPGLGRDYRKKKPNKRTKSRKSKRAKLGSRTPRQLSAF